MESKVSNSRIARNTLFLYLRTAVTIVINVWSIKVLWKTLGVDNYGIYSLIGGVVGMLTFISGSLTGATQRYLSYEMGRGNETGLNKVFSISLSIHLIIALIVMIVGETVGLWFVNTHLNLPPGSLGASNWMYQSVLFTFCLTVLTVPYNSCIIAHERMDVFGWIGILEVVLKLVIIYVIAVLPFDLLKSYAVLLVIVALIIRVINGFYCNRQFSECRFKRYSDKPLVMELLNFAKWTFVGTLGFAARDGGITVVFDKIFNVAVVAARGLALNVGNVITGFATNFTMALNPSIIKRYAAGEIDDMMSLVMKGSKYSLLLASIVVIPLIIAASLVYQVWLDDVAPFSVEFLQLSLILVLVECVVSPITTALQATGKIRLFQILICIIMLSNIPISWFLVKSIENPYIIYYVLIATSIIGIATRLWLLHGMVEFSYFRFLSTVYMRTLPCLLLIAVILYWIFRYMPLNFWGLAAFAVVSVAISCTGIYYVALDKDEKLFVTTKIRDFITKFKGLTGGKLHG